MSGCEIYLCRITGAYLGIPLQRCISAFHRVKKDLYSSRPLDPAVFSWQLRINSLLSALGRTMEPDVKQALLGDFWERFLSQIRPYSDVFETLGYLRDRGINTAIISNGIRAPQENKVSRLGIANLVKHRFYSEDAGKNKPAPAIYRLALKSIGAKPPEALMVGDICKVDIRGARDAGLHTCWYRGGAYSNLLPKNPAEQPEFTITTLSKLKSIV